MVHTQSEALLFSRFYWLVFILAVLPGFSAEAPVQNAVASGAKLQKVSLPGSDVARVGATAGQAATQRSSGNSTRPKASKRRSHRTAVRTLSGRIANVVPKFTRLGTLVNSSIVDNGAIVATRKPFQSARMNGIYVVDGATYPTIQAAISAACAGTPIGGTVFIPPGSYAQNSAFTLCSNLNIIGAGRCQADWMSCPTLITTTMTTGDLFPIVNMTDIHLSDFGVRSSATSAANAFIRLNYGQRVVAERLYLYGSGNGFNVGIELDSSSTSSGSTIRNHFEDIFIAGLAANGIGCLLNSNDASEMTINNNYFVMVACQGGNNGVGLKVTNSNLLQNINENFFYGDEFACANGPGGTGIGIQFTSTATRGMTFISPNVESCGTGMNKAMADTISFFGGNFSSNGTNVIDSQPAFSQFLGTNTGGTVQQFSVAPGGGMDVDCLGVGGNVSCSTNNINGPPGLGLQAASTSQAFLDSTGFRLRSVTFTMLPAAADGTEIYCSDCNSTCTAGGNKGRTCFRENGAWTH